MTGDQNSFDLMVVSTVRALLDGYYNEFLYHGEDVIKIPSFVDYAYVWLGKYQVDPKTRKIQSYDTENDEDNQRLW